VLKEDFFCCRYYAEAGVEYPYSRPPSHLTPEAFQTIYATSPIRHLRDSYEKFPPTLFLLGGKDMRVSNTQGKALYHALRTRGVKTEVYEFPEDGHALDSVTASLRSWEATIEWFRSAGAEAEAVAGGHGDAKKSLVRPTDPGVTS
jgi:acetyl esterase/lipase